MTKKKKDNHRTNVRTPEHIAMQSYSQYSKYVQERLDKRFSKNEHAALCQMYIEGVAVITAFEKMMGKLKWHRKTWLTRLKIQIHLAFRLLRSFMNGITLTL